MNNIVKSLLTNYCGHSSVETPKWLVTYVNKYTEKNDKSLKAALTVVIAVFKNLSLKFLRKTQLSLGNVCCHLNLKLAFNVSTLYG